MEMNQLSSDSHLPPRKRLLAGFKKLNESSSSSSSSSSSNGSSSSSTDVQIHLSNLLTSRFNNDHNQSPEELVEATRSAAALAVKAAKVARTLANEKALISAKKIAAAKRALEFVDSFPKESSPKKNKMKKHVNVEVLYSKIRYDEDDLDRAIDNNNKDTRISRTCSKMQKKNKTVGDSGEEANSTLVKEKAEEEGKRRGRVKLKKLPLSICNSRYQENETSSVSQLPVGQPSEDGVIPVVISSSWKCQDLKAPECVKQNKAVRS